MQLLLGLLIIFTLLLPAPGRADEEKTFNGIKYACTGVGESKEDPRWEGYPLKLMFTGRGTAYVTYLEVEIQDPTGKQVFKADCDSPWLLVNLNPGNYQVTAKAHKKFTQEAKVSIQHGKQTSQVIRFPQISGE
jgi:hypothetical protein